MARVIEHNWALVERSTRELDATSERALRALAERWRSRQLVNRFRARRIYFLSRTAASSRSDE